MTYIQKPTFISLSNFTGIGMPSAISLHISVQYYVLLVNVRLQYFYLAHPTQTMTMTIKMANTNERRK